MQTQLSLNDARNILSMSGNATEDLHNDSEDDFVASRQRELEEMERQLESMERELEDLATKHNEITHNGPENGSFPLSEGMNASISAINEILSGRNASSGRGDEGIFFVMCLSLAFFSVFK